MVLHGQSFHEDLHATAQAQRRVKGVLLVDVSARQRPLPFELFSNEDQTLLLRRDAFIVLDLGFHVVERVERLDIQSYGFAPHAQHQVQRALLLDVV